ncbi:MAG: phosphate ABC transporter substrate-binding protein [Opitutae bacterium]|nr:phosphate ABC transporter substrate-binding protein [Opitutae bacterium]
MECLKRSKPEKGQDMKTSLKWILAALCLIAPLAAQAEETLSIKGSNTFGEELGPQLISAFRARNPGIAVAIESLGSASGIAGLLDGTCDIGATSRVLNEDEQRRARSRKIDLTFSVIGHYAVTVVVHERNPLNSLSDRAIRDIFTGKATNWKQVGGPDRPIVVLIRDATGGTHLGFQELAMDNLLYASTARGFASYTALADEIGTNPDAIGYVGMNLVAHPGLRALSINGIPPNDLAVNEGVYPYVRTVRLYTRAKSASPLAERFVRFVRSKTGQRIVKSVGFVPANLSRLPKDSTW